MDRRKFLGRGAAIMSAWTLGRYAAGQSVVAQARPNILLLVTDDQGMQMGCLGTRGLKTPNMDALAARGALLVNNVCTYPVCSPSRTTMMTGLYPHANGTVTNVFEHFMPRVPANEPPAAKARNRQYGIHAEIPTLPELLNAAGYRTAITHKFHMAPNEKYPWGAWIGGKDEAAKLAAFMKAGGPPFFIMHNISAPHRPFQQHIKRLNPAPVDPAAVELPAFLADTPLMRRDWANHLMAVEAADAEVGRALVALKESGQAERTIVIMAGDNGPAYQRGKMTEYPLGCRVPLIVAGPGIAPGNRLSKLSSLLDVMPTVLDYAGVEPSRPVHGISLRPLLDGRPGAKGHNYVVSEVHDVETRQQGRALFDGRLWYIRRKNNGQPRKLIADSCQEQPWGNLAYKASVEAKTQFPEHYKLMQDSIEHAPDEELFDLAQDPWSINNVLTDPAYSADLKRLRTALDRWIEETHDTIMASTKKEA